MIILYTIAVVLALQYFLFEIAKKKSKDTHDILRSLMRYNIIGGAAAFYLMIIIWLISNISSLFSTNIAIYYMISASLLLVGISLPFKMYSQFKRKKDGE